MANVFISYSRKDKETARRLAEACKAQELDVWIDWEGIEPTTDWWREIEKGIEEADNFLFLISPDSARSEVCKRELDHAIRNGKRLIPVVARDTKSDESPSELRRLHWVFLREEDDFPTVFGKLVTSVKTDYAWVQFHRRLQVKALEWERGQHENSFLLRGKDLQDAESQLVANASKDPHPTDLQREYVLRSRQASDRQRRTLVSVAFGAAIVMAALAVFGFVQAQLATTNAQKEQAASTLANANAMTAQAASTQAIANARTAVANEAEAKRQAKIALARQLAAQAQPLITTRNSKQVIAILLAIQSMQLFPSVEAFQILDRNLLAYHITHMTYDDDSFVTSVAFSPDGKYLVSGSMSPAFGDNTAQVWETATGKEVARMTHDDGVVAVAFSPDGRYVVSASWDKTARVWEAATGKEVARMTHDAGVIAVTFSPDGQYVVSRSDKTARVWDPATGREVADMTHGHQVNFAAFSPDGGYVVSAGCDQLSSAGSTCLKGSVRIWEALTGKEVHHMIQDSSVSSVVLSLDGKYVVSGSLDDTARVWEAATGREISHITNYHPGLSNHSGYSMYTVAFSPDGKYVVSGNDHTVRVWEVETGMQVARITHDDRVESVAFSPDSKYGVSWGSDGVAHLWEATTGAEISILVYETVNGDPSASGISSIAFSPDGKYLALGGCDHVGGVRCDLGGVHVWAISSKKNTITRMTQGLRVKSVAFSPDGRYIASAGCEELSGDLFTCSKGSTVVWEVTTGKEVVRTPEDPRVQSAAFSPDGKYILSTGCDTFDENLCDKGIITVWGTSSGQRIARMIHDGPIYSVAFSPDGKYIVSGGYDKTARIWEASTGKEIARMTHDGIVISVAFGPDGKYVASGDNKGTAVVWEATNGKEVSRMVHYPDRSVNAVAFSPNGKYVVSGSSDGTIRVWEAATGKEISIINYVDLDLAPAVHTVGFSPDGKYVVSGSCDQVIIEGVCIQGSARVWDADTGREITRMVHEGSVNSAAFSPDGKYVLSMDPENITRVWEAATGQEVARMTHVIDVTSVAFSPDGKYIVSGSINGRVTIWEYRAADLIADACSRVTRNLTGAEWKQYIGDVLPYQALCPDLPVKPELTFTP